MILESLPIQRRPLSEWTKALHVRVTLSSKKWFLPLLPVRPVCDTQGKLARSRVRPLAWAVPNPGRACGLVCAVMQRQFENRPISRRPCEARSRPTRCSAAISLRAARIVSMKRARRQDAQKLIGSRCSPFAPLGEYAALVGAEARVGSPSRASGFLTGATNLDGEGAPVLGGHSEYMLVRIDANRHKPANGIPSRHY